MNTLIKSVMLTSAFLYAQASFGAGYLDLGLGQSTVNYSEEGFALEGEDTYTRIGLGIRASDAAAFEFGFMDLGEITETIQVPFDSFDVTASADGMYLDVKFGSPADAPVGFFGKIGMLIWDSEICADFASDCAAEDGNDIFFGGGLAFGSGNAKVNLEIQKFSLDDVDVDTVGISFNFGGGK
jgi:hypothetical protein